MPKAENKANKASIIFQYPGNFSVPFSKYCETYDKLSTKELCTNI